MLENAAIAFSHGDLLLRNVIADETGLVLVDWECAGPHLRDWDLALLWTQLAPASREPVEQAARSRWDAFLGLVVFALVREVRFLQAFNVDDRDPAMRRTRGELADAIARLPR